MNKRQRKKNFWMKLEKSVKKCKDDEYIIMRVPTNVSREFTNNLYELVRGLTETKLKNLICIPDYYNLDIQSFSKDKAIVYLKNVLSLLEDKNNKKEENT